MEILKKNKDFGNIKDISSYVNSALKELINEKDNIIVELNLKKLSDNFNIDYETIKDKYNKLIKKKKRLLGILNLRRLIINMVWQRIILFITC